MTPFFPVVLKYNEYWEPSDHLQMNNKEKIIVNETYINVLNLFD